MLRMLLGKLLLFRKMLPGGDSPRHLALGVAMGVLLGLVPKTNLTAVVISTLIFASTINIGTALLTAAAVSMSAEYFDPVTDYLGHEVLTHPSLQPYWTQFFDLPVAPWTDLNNTVVAGGVILGILLFIPTYRLTRPVFQRFWTRTDKRSSKKRRTTHAQVPAAEQPFDDPHDITWRESPSHSDPLPRPERRAA